MLDILDHVEMISRHRDRSMLGACVVIAMFEQTGARYVALHAVRLDLAKPLFATYARRSGAELLGEEEDVALVEAPQILEEHPVLARSIESGQFFWQNENADGSVDTLITVSWNGREGRVLELRTQEPLTPDQATTVSGLIALYRNCLQLLDYSERDTLTGLSNRKTFDERLARMLHEEPPDDTSRMASRLPRRRHSGPDTHHWLAVVDIDHFKQINDRFGHLYGDEVLILMAQVLRSAFRHTDRIFRFGGEEFVVVLAPTEPQHARMVFERCRRKVEETAFPQVGRVTISLGYCRIAPGDTPNIILGNADEALYHCKRNGRNQVCSYEELQAAGSAAAKHLNTDVEFF